MKLLKIQRYLLFLLVFIPSCSYSAPPPTKEEIRQRISFSKAIHQLHTARRRRCIITSIALGGFATGLFYLFSYAH